ncbi:uncharacterized protein LOC132803420 [Ziziphus jujuba]|uniref:Uncharacterized protein LOC132803420 n=1 Tax=Ziziphus jujuba TaxID=326968 RepID=A0ABM4A6P9_ZIZJJ|nr:uncharacterized protein LOC132803420 [Ziziphus jujuba]
MSELRNKIWKVLLKETKKENLKPGDHIYTWTGANTKEHGIYLNSGCVIHFTQGRRRARSDDRHSTCPNCSDHGVVTSCIDCFLSGGDHLHRFEYGVNPALILTKLAGGATLAPADPSPLVESRASNFLIINSYDSGSYYRFINNGKDFAMYCKTGLLVIDNINFSRSWQAAAFFLAVTVTFFLFQQQSTAATYPGVAAICFGLYCIYRFGSDIGARPNVIKVDQVATLPDVAEKLSSAASGVRPIQSLIDLFIVLLMTYFNLQLLLTVRTWSEPLQLLSETPRVVWILACIYVGGSVVEVIELVRGGDPILPSSASSHSSDIPISTSSAKESRVEYCSLDSFLSADELYLYKYGVSLAFFIAKFLGGTCTLGSTDRPETVVYHSRQELRNGSGTGDYNLFNNNCEDFAIYCKTKLPPRKLIINLGRNGQIVTYFGVFFAILIFIIAFQPSNPIGVAATVYFIYSVVRFVADATHCGKAYQVALKILPPWRSRGRFPVVPQFMHLEGKIVIF